MMTSVTQNFNWVDYTILAIIGISAIISFFRGFVREAISLVAWIVGIFIALKYAGTLQNYLSAWISSESIRYFIAFVGIFIAIVFLGLLLNIVIGTIISKVGLSVPNRFLGIIFGALRGVAIVSVMLLMLMNMGTAKDSAALLHSQIASKFKPVVAWLNGFLPEKMKSVGDWVGDDFKDLHKQT